MQSKNRIDEILERLRQAQSDLEHELDQLLEDKREQFHYTIRRGRVVFERNFRRLQRMQRKRSWRYILESPISYVLSAPIIYGMIIPLAALDLSITIYQHICFRIYNIPRVKRSDYIIIDRHHLAYLNMVEKFNCVYCGYGNGLIAYAREIIARTEQFWCPIKHARRVSGQHERQETFLDYGDAHAWQARKEQYRKALNAVEYKG